MYIKQIQLSNFKRFTELTIDLSGVDEPPKLVLLIGANGSGKTSVFDAFGLLSRAKGAQGSLLWQGQRDYYKKNSEQDSAITIKFTDDREIKQTNGRFSDGVASEDEYIFYGRSTLRQVPQLSRKGRGNTVDLFSDPDRPPRYIDRDQRFENDIDSITQRILEEVFVGDDFDSQQLRETYISPINQAMGRIFGTEHDTALSLVSLIPPTANKSADIRFRKGESEIHYDLLSSGEKEVFNILLNLFNRRSIYSDSIYFIDELDVHLNTALQYTLLKEITEYWIPDGCQLWTASHSLGFIQYAQESDHAVILDFDQYDFDLPRTIVPEVKDAADVYNIAVPVDSLAALFQDKDIVFCENQDAGLYNRLGIERKIFVPAKDKNDVYYRAKNNPGNFGLMDRDYLTDEEIELIRRDVPNLLVLKYYSIESYLYHPDNLAELVSDFNRSEYEAELLQQKQAIRISLVTRLRDTRHTYKMLPSGTKKANDKNGKNAELIAHAIESDSFEEYYPYLDMKSKVDKSFINYNFSRTSLASTNWFCSQISRLFE